MITMRDVIADCFRSDEEPMMYDAPKANANRILAAILSADDSVQLELAALLNPWRPIETAPNEELILGLVAGQHLIVQRYAREWWSWVYGKGILHAEQMKTAPTHWLPLPAPPSEDKT